jgi:hypothetical protein
MIAPEINWEIYTPYAGAAGMLLHINGKFTMGKLRWYLLSFLTAPHCQFGRVGQGMKQKSAIDILKYLVRYSRTGSKIHKIEVCLLIFSS